MVELRRCRAWLFLVLVFAACGDTGLTLSEYAAGAEQLVAELEKDFLALDAEWESGPPTATRAERYWQGRLAIRAEFLDGVQALQPPEEVAALHATALDLFTRIKAADEALSDRVATLGELTDHWQWAETAEGRAADAVLEEVFAFCRASQAEFDATSAREPLQDVGWIPGEASEVVRIAFGCPP